MVLTNAFKKYYVTNSNGNFQGGEKNKGCKFDVGRDVVGRNALDISSLDRPTFRKSSFKLIV